MLKSVFFSILTHFSIGLVFTVLFVSMEEIGRLFFRITTLIALALILFALAAQPFPQLSFAQMFYLNESDENLVQRLTYLFFVLSATTITFFNVVLPRYHRPLLILACALGLAGVGSYSLALAEPTAGPIVLSLIHIFNGIGSALLLGSVLAAMITGHWYLVHHKLSLNPLKSSSKIYIGSVGLRILIILISSLFYADISGETNIVSHVQRLDFGGMLILSRVAFGVIIPLVFGIMVWKSTVIRSTQSATGILYATIVLVLIGETFGKYLFFLVGVPL